AGGGASQASVPLRIHQFRLKDGHFQFIDYDVQAGGFVIALDGIQATVKDIAMPAKDEKTSYRLEARMGQGRDRTPAALNASGWTMFSNYDTDALVSVNDL